MKVLFVATVTEHIKAFHIPYLKWFKEQGWEVHVATYGDDEISYCDKKHNISVARSPFRFSNIKAYFELKTIIKKEKYDIIHGHTPMGGVLTRLCGKSQRRKNTHIMYTAHGFHFCKGAPLLNWGLYYPMEKWLSRYTDALITINKEDYALASQNMKAKKTYYIHGIGVDTTRFINLETPEKTDIEKAARREEKRNELGIPIGATVLISVGELSKRKNHQAAIKALGKVKKDDMYYVICGRGELDEFLRNLCNEAGVDKKVIFLGHRTDIPDLLNMSDIFVFPSLWEGLGLAAIEAMACGLPIVTSNIHGINDYSENGITGYSCTPTDVDGFAKAIKNLAKDAKLRKKMGEHNIEAAKKFDLSGSLKEMEKIYKETM